MSSDKLVDTDDELPNADDDSDSLESTIPISDLSSSPTSENEPSPVKRMKYGRKVSVMKRTGRQPFLGTGSTHARCLDDDMGASIEGNGGAGNDISELGSDTLNLGSDISLTGSDSMLDDTDGGTEDSNDGSVLDNDSVSDSDCGSDSSRASSSESNCSDNSRNDVQKLFSGSSRSTEEAVLALMDLFVKKRWKVTTLKDVLCFCSEFFPSNMPKTVYKIFEYVKSYAPDNYSEICHYYCADCRSRKKEKADKCFNCQSSSTGVFYELPLSTEIKHYFEHCGLASLIDNYRNQMSDTLISDTGCSSCYKDIKITENGQYDITLLYNSDGVSLVNSSEAHLYPILATICELPPHLRSGFMLVCGVWYDAKFAPNMNCFFEPFVNALIEIGDKKIVWTHPLTQEKIKSSVVAPVLSADAVARADILVMQHHNGKYGCNSCEQKTKRFQPQNGGKKIRRYLFQENPARLREKNRMDDQGQKAADVGAPVKGVVGAAVVSKIPYFNRASAAVPDYMHCVLLGVVRYFLKLWITVPGDWNIKNKLADIDNFIVNIKVTDEYGRILKPLKDLVHWKASDLRAWLLFFSVPALAGYLKDKYFQHYLLLVSAIYSLLKQDISQIDVTRAEIKLRMFVREIAKLYRLNDYTYNVHNLLHLADFVRRWGPLWALSLFIFEDFNHVLGELAPGTKHKGKQIVNKIKIAHGVEILRSKVLLENQKVTSKNGVLGQSVRINLDLSSFDISDDTPGYVRARINGHVFTSEQYDEKVKRANSFVRSKTQTSVVYGQVLYFYEKQSEIHCFVKKFTVNHNRIFSHNEARVSIGHLIPICVSDIVVSVNASSLTKLAKAGDYLCIRPNIIEKNL